MLAAEDNDKKGKSLKITHISDAILRAISPLAKPRLSAESKFAQLHQALKDTHQSGQRTCVVIEEAHCLSIPALKHLKRLHELEPNHGYGSLISIILIGQPELHIKLSEKNPEIRELVQRCELVTLQPIAVSELEDFIDHRLKRIGKKAADVIDQGGITALADRLVNSAGQSQLYPLLVGNFLIKAMNDAAQIGSPVIDESIVKDVK
jgi:type II secretory pathway predicted ATPase ExeA